MREARNIDEIMHLLMKFGLTHQEAKIYAVLYGAGTVTGYELAKLTGISRSNAYSALSSLVDKGGACLIDGKPAKYAAVPVNEFCGNVIRALSQTQKTLENSLTLINDSDDEYLTIKGKQNICDKIENIIHNTKKHIYLSMPCEVLQMFSTSLSVCVENNVKVVSITNGEISLPGAVIYHNPEQADAIRIISDTSCALTGSLPDEAGCSCLYSRKQNLVQLLRDSMSNEIKLIKNISFDSTAKGKDE